MGLQKNFHGEEGANFSLRSVPLGYFTIFPHHSFWCTLLKILIFENVYAAEHSGIFTRLGSTDPSFRSTGLTTAERRDKVATYIVRNGTVVLVKIAYV